MVLVLFSPYFKAPSVCFTLFIPHYIRPVKAMTLTGVLRDVWIFIRKKQSFVGRRMKSGCTSSSRSRQPDIWSKGLLPGLEDGHNSPASTSCSVRNSGLFLCGFFPPDFGAFRPACMDFKQKKCFHAGNDPLPFNQRLHFLSIDRLIFFWGLPSALLEKQGY